MKKYGHQFPATLLLCCAISFIGCDSKKSPQSNNATKGEKDSAAVQTPQVKTLDTADYNRRMQYLSNHDTSGKWPAKTVYPNASAILPFHRIVAYYGNLYSKQMGALGEFPENEMLERLQAEIKKWAAADSTTPVLPALHYIATTAQLQPGKEGKHTLRMPFAQIDTVLRIAKRIDALVFLDLQVGFSNVEREVPMLEKYMKMSHVHLGIDPEFSMKDGKRPGTVIGSMNAADINFVINYLTKVVKDNNLPPKILVVHRFTQKMVQDYKDIKPTPEVQVVIDMDGWGIKPKKINTYNQFTYSEPVQFTGFKIFYKNDTKRVNELKEMQPEDVLSLKPKPIYIQYQ
jgi:hypothetical protein